MECEILNVQAYVKFNNPSGDVWLDTTAGSCKIVSKNENFIVKSSGCSGPLQYICAKSGKIREAKQER